LDEAIAEYSEAIRLKPGVPEAYYNRGMALGAKQQLEPAIADFSEAVRLRPDYDAARLALGMALGASGRIDEAKRQFALIKGQPPK
jgi:tetratricopeptide (TPR) repeat protein